MDDLIRRPAAIDNMAMVIWGYPNEIYPQLNDYSMALGLAKDGLMGVPSVDAVEVVRCKDCKWHSYDSYCEKLSVIGFELDDFCSLGERKIDG